MSRAQGRHQAPRSSPEAAVGEDAQIGASTRTQGVPSPIPGGRPHIHNAPAVRQKVPTPVSQPEVYGVNAHGVKPGSHTNHERADLERGGPNPRVDLPYAVGADPVAPVPVYVVEGSGRRLRAGSTRSFAVNQAGQEGQLLCGVDPDRVAVLLLNEDAANDIRFADQPGALAGGGGALLPHAATSYLRLDTQDELWAIAAGANNPRVSVIQVYERNG